VITSVVVSYRVRPEAVAEHVRLIEAVFEQLRTERPAGVLPPRPHPFPFIRTRSKRARYPSIETRIDRCAR
jgi:hypothetical protein